MNTRQIYYTIIEQIRSQRLIPFVPFSIPNMWKQIYNNILPNYLKTFSHKIIWNLMPEKSRPYLLHIMVQVCVLSVINNMKLSPIYFFRVLSYKVCGTSLCF